MKDDRSTRQTMSLEETTISNRWEIVKAHALARMCLWAGLNSRRAPAHPKTKRWTMSDMVTYDKVTAVVLQHIEQYEVNRRRFA